MVLSEGTTEKIPSDTTGDRSRDRPTRMGRNVGSVFFFHGSTALFGQDLIIEASRSHSYTPHSVGLLWTSDHTDAETSACTTHTTHNRQTSTLPAGFEPAIPSSERPQTHVLDRAVTIRIRGECNGVVNTVVESN